LPCSELSLKRRFASSALSCFLGCPFTRFSRLPCLLGGLAFGHAGFSGRDDGSPIRLPFGEFGIGEFRAVVLN
jgi:hypothetical protein